MVQYTGKHTVSTRARTDTHPWEVEDRTTRSFLLSMSSAERRAGTPEQYRLPTPQREEIPYDELLARNDFYRIFMAEIGSFSVFTPEQQERAFQLKRSNATLQELRNDPLFRSIPPSDPLWETETVRNAIVCANLRLIPFFIKEKRYLDWELTAEEVVSVGNMALVKAVDAYGRKPGSFSTLVGAIFHNEIIRERTQRTYRGIPSSSLDERRGDSSLSPTSPPAPIPIFEALHANELPIKPQERDYLLLRYEEGQTQERAARAVGKKGGREAARQYEQRVLAKLKTYLDQHRL